MFKVFKTARFDSVLIKRSSKEEQIQVGDFEKNLRILEANILYIIFIVSIVVSNLLIHKIFERLLGLELSEALLVI